MRLNRDAIDNCLARLEQEMQRLRRITAEEIAAEFGTDPNSLPRHFAEMGSPGEANVFRSHVRWELHSFIVPFALPDSVFKYFERMTLSKNHATEQAAFHR